MKEHKGMRPQDIVIILKLISLEERHVRVKDLAAQLHISASEVSESINRSVIAGLISKPGRRVEQKTFLQFLEFGLPYVFPAQLGPVKKGIYTAHSESSLYLSFSSEDKLVWADPEGKERGTSIIPLYPGVLKAVRSDRLLYTMLSLCDILRVGNPQEKKKAVWHLTEIFERKNE